MKKILALGLVAVTLVFLVGCKVTKETDSQTQIGEDVEDKSLDELTNEIESGLGDDEFDTSDLDNLDEELNLDWLE